MTTTWEKIEAFDLDKPVAEYGFSTRLAFENHWTIGFTEGAILEYKKFMFLAATSDKMVSPSPIVDIVWHQHLIFTESYVDFCQLLGKRIAHVPSTHDPKQADAFREAEKLTAQQYEAVFGPQPAEYWTKHTMTDSLPFKRSAWNIQKILLVGGALFLAMLFPVAFALQPVFVGISGGTFLIGFSILTVITFVSLIRYSRWISEKIGAEISGLALIKELRPEELVFMQSGRLVNVIHGHVNTLVKSGVLAIGKDKTISLTTNRQPKNAMVAAVSDTVADAKKIHYSSLAHKLLAKPAFRQISKSADVIDRRFKASRDFTRYFAVNYAVLLLLLGIGLSRLIIGVTRDKPVLFLAILLIVVMILAIRHLVVESRFFLRHCIPNLFRDKILKQPTHDDAPDWGFFLLGNAVMAAAFLPLMADAKEKDSGFWGGASGCGAHGSACGSSCGSSCGSGCGGCGGS